MRLQILNRKILQLLQLTSQSLCVAVLDNGRAGINKLASP